VEIEVNKGNGVVRAEHVYGAMDCGLTINPGIVESQIVGMSVHGTSLALKEEVQFNQRNVTSLDWNTYQTLRFGDHPAVTPIVVQQINEKSSGAGEEVLPAVVAAIGNAFFDATGVRLRQFPLTPQRVLGALKPLQETGRHKVEERRSPELQQTSPEPNQGAKSMQRVVVLFVALAGSAQLARPPRSPRESPLPTSPL
jgi:Molybdopterin-binding domain of aldehyde dehydrogenase